MFENFRILKKIKNLIISINLMSHITIGIQFISIFLNDIASITKNNTDFTNYRQKKSIN
jgi:hypothetical protein